MSEQDAISLLHTLPNTVSTLEADFITSGVQSGMTLIVHSSLSSLGWVCGGAVSVILSLEEVLSPEGTLVMPAHSGDLSDPAGWSNPPVPEDWFEIIRKEMPCFDKDLTPTRGMEMVPSRLTVTVQEPSTMPHTSMRIWSPGPMT